MLEQPDYRLPAAEEALRQIVAIIEQLLLHYEPLLKELAGRAADARGQIDRLIGGLQSANPKNRRPQNMANLLELLRVYPKWRYQTLILQRVVSIYLSLRGFLSDQLLHLNFCRARLVELKESLATTNSEAGFNKQAHERLLLPPGAATVQEASTQLLQSISTSELANLDSEIQSLVQQQFTSLAHVCLTTSNLLRNLQPAMQRHAEAFVDARLAGTDATSMYFSLQSDEQQIEKELTDLFQLSAPPLTAPRGSSQAAIAVLAAPTGPAGERLRALVRARLPEANWTTAAAGRDDIVFYRELTCASLPELDQLGPLGLEAYQQVAALEHFTPHSRTDISQWRSESA
jgi:hypothetical protein